MPWPFKPWPNNADWAHVDNANAFFFAVTERARASGQEFSEYIQIGDDVSYYAVWYQLQHWIAFNCHRFVRSHNDAGELLPENYYEGKELELWEPATLFRAAQLEVPPDNAFFRRATTKPADWTDINDPAYMFGYMEPGDIIGPWIFEDLQRVLNLLVWSAVDYDLTGAVLIWMPDYEQGATEWFEGQDSAMGYDTWPEAKTKAEAAWPNGSSFLEFTVAGVASYGYHYSAMPYAEHAYDAAIARLRRRAVISYVWWGVNRSAVFSWKSDTAMPPGIGQQQEQWEACGDFPERNYWVNFDTTAPGQLTAIQSALAGKDSTVIPTWVAEPPMDESRYCGWQNPQVRAFIRWDVEGGFEYV